MEARRRLIELLRQHEATDEKEVADLERMLEYADALEQPFSRDQAEAHFTASALVVDAKGLRTCLVHHRKLLRWLQPGGHFDPEDRGDIARAALREVKEETHCDARLHVGAAALLDVDIHTIPARAGQAEHLHLDLRLLATVDRPEQLNHDPNESLDARWLSWAEARVLADGHSLRRALDKAEAIVSG